MADSGPAMSGAKDSTTEETPIMLPPAVETTPETTPETTTAETQKDTTVATDAPVTAATAVTAVTTEETAPEKGKEPAKETTATGQPESSSETASPSPADGETAVPQVPPPAVIRARTNSLAIGAHGDEVSAAPADGLVVCNITLLLPTGARHPYRIDEKYLGRRNVDVPGVTESGQKDPFSISVYKLKELILREWREDWEGKPASPSSIRLIHFGKLLEDKEQLKKYHFSAEAPNVVHMSVKPAEMLEEDEGGKSKSGSRETRSREGGSNCCVIL